MSGLRHPSGVTIMYFHLNYGLNVAIIISDGVSRNCPLVSVHECPMTVCQLKWRVINHKLVWICLSMLEGRIARCSPSTTWSRKQLHLKEAISWALAIIQLITSMSFYRLKHPKRFLLFLYWLLIWRGNYLALNTPKFNRLFLVVQWFDFQVRC